MNDTNSHVPLPPASTTNKPSARANILKRHIKASVVIITTLTVICAASLITWRLVRTEGSSSVPITTIETSSSVPITTTVESSSVSVTTTEEPVTTAIPPKTTNTYSKSQWGGKECSDQEALDEPVHLVIVKHTKSQSCEDFSSCSTAMRELQSIDVDTNHLSDIRFNFVIGGDGNIYEGRGWGIRNEQMNNSVDIAYIGDFNVQIPTDFVVNAGMVLFIHGLFNGHFTTDTVVVCHNQTEITDSPGENLFREVIKWDYYSDEIINGTGSRGTFKMVPNK